METQENDIKF